MYIPRRTRLSRSRYCTHCGGTCRASSSSSSPSSQAQVAELVPGKIIANSCRCHYCCCCSSCEWVCIFLVHFHYSNFHHRRRFRRCHHDQHRSHRCASLSPRDYILIRAVLLRLKSPRPPPPLGGHISWPFIMNCPVMMSVMRAKTKVRVAICDYEQ